MTHRTGAYVIRNLINGKFYVGGAYKDFDQRFEAHKYLLRKGEHYNIHLQRAWTKYGEKAFRFVVLERCPPDRVEDVEQKWIDRTQAVKTGYNRSPRAGSQLGIRYGDEFKEKMRRIVTGRKYPDAVKKKQSEAAIRRYQDPLQRAAQSDRTMGRKPSEEARRNMSLGQQRRFQDPEQRRLNGHNKGRKFSAAARANMAEAQRRRSARETDADKKARGAKIKDGIAARSLRPDSAVQLEMFPENCQCGLEFVV